MAELRELEIARLGAQGDGIADVDGRPVYVPFALPGEAIVADVDGDRGKVDRIVEPSGERIAPVCPHFGICGGCVAQHMSPSLYATWKRDIVAAAFRARGLDVAVEALATPSGKRRRASLAARRGERGIVLGFHEAGSHALVAIEACPVLEPSIVAALPSIRAMLAPLVSGNGEVRVVATWTRAGLDIEIYEVAKKLSQDVRRVLALASDDHKLARLAVNGELVFETLSPNLNFGMADVVIPPGVFLQAVAEAETEIALRCVAAAGKSKSVADLFCGIGTLTFPLAAKARVSAFDGHAPAIDALNAAARKASGLKPIAAKVRDLFREPLSPLELNEHEAVVFDPPRAGAEAQAIKIARSKVKTVVAVSCNPATLARDARQLVDGGYRIESVTPIDQFVYSSHVEVVAVFRR